MEQSATFCVCGDDACKLAIDGIEASVHLQQPAIIGHASLTEPIQCSGIAEAKLPSCQAAKLLFLCAMGSAKKYWIAEDATAKIVPRMQGPRSRLARRK